jgi:hypothetical protein
MDEIKKTPEQVAMDFQKSREVKPTEPVAKAESAPATDSSSEKKESGDIKTKVDAEVKQVEKIETKPEENEKKDKVQRRIDELVGKIKALESERFKDRDQIRALETQITTLSTKPVQIDEADFSQKEANRLKTYLEEDKSKPRAQRREMSREDLEDWIVEDMVSAQEWMVDKKLRRKDEAKKDREEFEKKTSAEMLKKSQKASQDRVLSKHPDIDTASRQEELKAQGKSKEEISAIIFKERPKVEAIVSVLRDNPGLAQRIAGLPNGPEILMDEVEKRISSKTHKDESVDAIEDALDEGAEAERQRQSDVDASVHSTREPKTISESKDAMYNARLKIFLRTGKTKADLDKALVRRQKVGVE